MPPPRRKWKRYVALVLLLSSVTWLWFGFNRDRMQWDRFNDEFHSDGGMEMRDFKISTTARTIPLVRSQSFENEAGTRIWTSFTDKYNIEAWIGRAWVDRLLMSKVVSVEVSSDEELRKLAELIDLSEAGSITLNSPRVTSASVDMLIGQLSELTTLHMTETALHDEDIARLTELRSLQSLSLTNISITDRGLMKLTEVGPLRDLEIKFADAYLDESDELPPHLGAPVLLDAAATRSNRLPENPNDSGKRVFKYPKSSLVYVPAASFSLLTAAGVDEFKATRPDCQVKYEND